MIQNWILWLIGVNLEATPIYNWLLRLTEILSGNDLVEIIIPIVIVVTHSEQIKNLVSKVLSNSRLSIEQFWVVDIEKKLWTFISLENDYRKHKLSAEYEVL